MNIGDDSPVLQNGREVGVLGKGGNLELIPLELGNGLPATHPFAHYTTRTGHPFCWWCWRTQSWATRPATSRSHPSVLDATEHLLLHFASQNAPIRERAASCG